MQLGSVCVGSRHGSARAPFRPPRVARRRERRCGR
jgi:hypothetical protein